MAQPNGRVALVTGGSRGIGRAIVLALAADGCDVAINFRRDGEAASETAAFARDHGVRAEIYQADVGDPHECAAMVRAIEGDVGPVDILIANAGVASRGQSVVDTDLDEVERMWRTHALGAFALSKAVLPAMRRAPRGDIVLVSSVITEVTPANTSPYAMAKAALEALGAVLAKEEREHGIHVNVVAPGLVVTDMGRRLMQAVAGVEEITDLDETSPFGRVCRPEDIASVVRFLVSDGAGYVTGQRVRVDGGG